jgi:hypothetical protein
MSDVRTGGRSIDDRQLDTLISRPCATLAALMTAQLPASPELADGLAKLDQARELFTRAAAFRPFRPPEGAPPK